MNWTEYFFEMAKVAASKSKDRSRGVGAVIANDDKRILSVGYNGFPSGCNDNIEERHERPAKYLWTEHAERNAIYSAGRSGVPLIGATMYVTLFPCPGCARAIIQSGIKKVFTIKPDFEDKNWGEKWQVSMEMLYDGGVALEFIKI